MERELEASVLRARSNGYRGDAGAAIVTDLQGRVLAMASYPDYDLNIWENGITVRQAKELYSEATGFQLFRAQYKESLRRRLPSKLFHLLRRLKLTTA